MPYYHSHTDIVHVQSRRCDLYGDGTPEVPVTSSVPVLTGHSRDEDTLGSHTSHGHFEWE